MPIIKSAKKAQRQAIKRKSKNEAIKKEINSTRKAVLKNPTAENVSAAQSAYDKAFKKGLIKKNTASRRKAKIAKLAKSLSGAKPAKKATAKKTTVAKKATAAKAPAKKATVAKKPATKKTASKKAE